MQTTQHEEIAAELSRIAAVESVYISAASHALSIVTVILDEDEYARDRIYQVERGLFHSHPDLNFDFNVVALEGRTEADLFGSRLAVWHRNSCLTPTNI